MTSSSLTVRLSANCPTGNFWVDTGLVVLLQQFGEGEHPVENILRWLQSQLIQASGNKGKYYDEQAWEIREYDKVNWVYPTNLFIKVGRASKIKVRVNGKEETLFTELPTFELSLRSDKESISITKLHRKGSHAFTSDICLG